MLFSFFIWGLWKTNKLYCYIYLTSFIINKSVLLLLLLLYHITLVNIFDISAYVFFSFLFFFQKAWFVIYLYRPINRSFRELTAGPDPAADLHGKLAWAWISKGHSQRTLMCQKKRNSYRNLYCHHTTRFLIVCHLN